MEGEGVKRDREEEAVAAVPAADSGAAVKKVRTHKKRRMCVVYGYRGKGYHGSTQGGGPADRVVPTVEGDMEKVLWLAVLFVVVLNCGFFQALKAAGAIDEMSDLGKISFSRASRTDKGVSAMANAFGANLYFSAEELENRSLWIDRVNSFLPGERILITNGERFFLLRLLAEQIRVWAALRVRGSFSAKVRPSLLL